MKEKMSFQEKQSILSLFNSILILGIYSLYIYQKHLLATPELINDFKFWGKIFAILIPIVIVVQIVMHILFYIGNTIITRENPPEKHDEMDKMIELKSIRLSHWIFILGFFLAMGSQALGMANWVIYKKEFIWEQKISIMNIQIIKETCIRSIDDRSSNSRNDRNDNGISFFNTVVDFFNFSN